MIASIIYEFPLGWLVGIPLLGALTFAAWRQHRRGLEPSRIVALSALRLSALLPLVFLAARPLCITKTPPAAASRPVMLLIDRSESMSLEENDATRYQQVLN